MRCFPPIDLFLSLFDNFDTLVGGYPHNPHIPPTLGYRALTPLGAKFHIAQKVGRGISSYAGPPGGVRQEVAPANFKPAFWLCACAAKTVLLVRCYHVLTVRKPLQRRHFQHFLHFSLFAGSVRVAARGYFGG